MPVSTTSSSGSSHVGHSSVATTTQLHYHLGMVTTMAKVNIRDAYHIIPTTTTGLGQVAEETHFHKQLPYGLASATAIFSTLAKALEWVLQHRGLSKL